MSIEVEVRDALTGNIAKVSSRGQLIVAPLSYSEPHAVSLSAINTAFTLVVPETRKQFVVTGVIMNADKSVSSANGALIEIYEATSPDSIIVNKSLFRANIERNALHPITGLNVILSKGVWVNAKTDDATVAITLLGYYVVTED